MNQDGIEKELRAHIFHRIRRRFGTELLPVIARLLGGISRVKVSPLLARSNAWVRNTGTSPNTRSIVGLRKRI